MVSIQGGSQLGRGWFAFTPGFGWIATSEKWISGSDGREHAQAVRIRRTGGALGFGWEESLKWSGNRPEYGHQRQYRGGFQCPSAYPDPHEGCPSEP